GCCAWPLLKLCEGAHPPWLEREAEDVGVLRDARRVHGLWKHDHAVLNAPPQQNLRVRFLHGLRHRRDDGMIDERSVRERAVRLDDDVLRLAESARVPLL